MLQFLDALIHIVIALFTPRVYLRDYFWLTYWLGWLLWDWDWGWLLVRMEEEALHVNEFLNDGDGVEQLGVLVLPLPVELYLRLRWGLQSDDVREVLVLNCLVNCQSVVRVERDKFGQQVDSQRRHVWELLSPQLVPSQVAPTF